MTFKLNRNNYEHTLRKWNNEHLKPGVRFPSNKCFFHLPSLTVATFLKCCRQPPRIKVNDQSEWKQSFGLNGAWRRNVNRNGAELQWKNRQIFTIILFLFWNNQYAGENNDYIYDAQSSIEIYIVLSKRKYFMTLQTNTF